MDTTTICVLALAALLSTLGFVALLKTKIYAIEGTKETELDVPILGKITTNYPALVFVLLGCGLAAYAIKASGDEQQLRDQISKEFAPVDWVITGQFLMPPGSPKGADVRIGTIGVRPQPDPAPIYEDGTYEMHLKLNPGVDFETVALTIVYTYGNEFGTVQIDPAKELDAFNKNPQTSLLLKKGDLSRTYKPVPIVWSSP